MPDDWAGLWHVLGKSKVVPGKIRLGVLLAGGWVHGVGPARRTWEAVLTLKWAGTGSWGGLCGCITAREVN